MSDTGSKDKAVTGFTNPLRSDAVMGAIGEYGAIDGLQQASYQADGVMSECNCATLDAVGVECISKEINLPSTSITARVTDAFGDNRVTLKMHNYYRCINDSVQVLIYVKQTVRSVKERSSDIMAPKYRGECL